MKITTFSFSLVTAFLLGALTFFVVSDKEAKETTEIKTKVETIYKDRIVERIVYKQKIDTIRSSTRKKMESLKTASNAGKIDSAFKEEFPSIDTTSKLIPVSERQLEDCIETKYKNTNDSLELLVTRENLDSCDSKVDQLSSALDSVVIIKNKTDKRIKFWKRVAIITSTIATTLFLLEITQ